MSNIPVKTSLFIEKIVVVQNSKIVRYNMKTCKYVASAIGDGQRRLQMIANIEIEIEIY
jgi:hypothetical protein